MFMTAHYPYIAEDARPEPAPAVEWRRQKHFWLYRSILKRGIDVLVVLLGLPVILPLLGILALAISLDGHSPFYRQKRLGRHGRIFTLWKLRSMVAGADAQLEAHLSADPAARAEWTLTQKLKEDPRITGIGRFLRKSSADELPQLWNVLRGDMSLVGPRPMMPDQAPLYPGTAYYVLRPGITGSWQVSARNESSFADRARFDTDYEQRISVATDLAILLATVRVVLRGTGH
jgi:lipopolysaccharide/colanic/teichoic acid biosynthesis glycosyltransferase